MKNPFGASTALYANSPVPMTSNGVSAGSIGGSAPQNQTVGVRRDFTFTPQFLPSLTIPGGLRQPPRG
jgi:hypothetical protein